MSSHSPRPKVDRAAIACQNCRQRKVRCTGGEPCKDCLRLKKTCVYPTVQRRKRKPKETHILSSHDTPPMRSMERVWDIRPSSNKANEGAQSSSQLLQDNLGSQSVSVNSTSIIEHDAHPSSNWSQEVFRSPLPTTGEASEPNSVLERSETVHPRPVIHRGNSTSGADKSHFESIRRERSTKTDEDDNWQYHEPWAWTSICSETGARWIWSVSGSHDFFAAAKRFANDIVRRRPYEKYLSANNALTDTCEATAWEYVDAFYQNCWEANLGLIDRTDFETHLKAHYRSQKSKDESAWLALRSIVFACGYRSLLAKDSSMSFATAQAKAGCYFKDALSVFTEILLPPSSLMAVRALALMACYAEGLGNPAFKHLLCSNAVHLALSKGLHRQPDKAWTSSEAEKLKRNWLWWALYALEKDFALFDGRPSAIDDDNISAQIPITLPSGSNGLSFNIGIRCSKIQSQMSRRLFSISALSLTVTELIGIVSHFDNQLNQLLNEIPVEYKIGPLARPQHSTRQLIEILYLHFSIYGTIMAVHAHFFYPWMAARFATDGYNNALETQLVSSSNAVAEAARKIILGLRLVTVNVATPSWLGFQYPIYAVINLFIYILKYPSLTTATADLGLLDVCAGHFGYIDFLTSSQVSIALPREAANVASKVVKVANAKSSAPTTTESTQSLDNHDNVQARISNDASYRFDNMELSASVNGMGTPTNIDMTGGWNLLSSFNMMNSNGPNFETLA